MRRAGAGLVTGGWCGQEGLVSPTPSVRAAVGGPSRAWQCGGCAGPGRDHCTPRPTLGLAPHGQARVCPPSLASARSHQCQSVSPNAWRSAVPSQVPPAWGRAGCGVGSTRCAAGRGRGLHSALCPSPQAAGPLGTEACHHPLSWPQGHPWVWAAAPGEPPLPHPCPPWVSPAVLQSSLGR